MVDDSSATNLRGVRQLANLTPKVCRFIPMISQTMVVFYLFGDPKKDRKGVKPGFQKDVSIP